MSFQWSIVTFRAILDHTFCFKLEHFLDRPLWGSCFHRKSRLSQNQQEMRQRQVNVLQRYIIGTELSQSNQLYELMFKELPKIDFHVRTLHHLTLHGQYLCFLFILIPTKTLQCYVSNLPWSKIKVILTVMIFVFTYFHLSATSLISLKLNRFLPIPN